MKKRKDLKGKKARKNCTNMAPLIHLSFLYKYSRMETELVSSLLDYLRFHYQTLIWNIKKRQPKNPVALTKLNLPNFV